MLPLEILRVNFSCTPKSTEEVSLPKLISAVAQGLQHVYYISFGLGSTRILTDFAQNKAPTQKMLDYIHSRGLYIAARIGTS